MKHLGSLESTQEANLSCSPNFPRASYLDESTLMYEPIVNLLSEAKYSGLRVVSFPISSVASKCLYNHYWLLSVGFN